MSEHETGDAVFDPGRDWAVYRCTHGCLHLALDRLMSTLTAEEFHDLRVLLDRAGARFQGARAIAPPPRPRVPTH